MHANSGGICSRTSFINERFRHDDDGRDDEEEKENATKKKEG